MTFWERLTDRRVKERVLSHLRFQRYRDWNNSPIHAHFARAVSFAAMDGDALFFKRLGRLLEKRPILTERPANPSVLSSLLLEHWISQRGLCLCWFSDKALTALLAKTEGVFFSRRCRAKSARTAASAESRASATARGSDRGQVPPLRGSGQIGRRFRLSVAEPRHLSLNLRVIKTSDAENIDRASDGLLTKRELATRLRVSTRTLDDWQRRGRICHLKIGKSCRYRWPDVLSKLQTFRVN